jgi:DNA-binding PadR family transcriptional regulator
VLYRFTENGYITDHDEIVGKRLRKYYHLEKRGKAYYNTLLSEYKKIAKGVELITEGEDPHDEA